TSSARVPLAKTSKTSRASSSVVPSGLSAIRASTASRLSRIGWVLKTVGKGVSGKPAQHKRSRGQERLHPHLLVGYPAGRGPAGPPGPGGGAASTLAASASSPRASASLPLPRAAWA